MKLLTPVLVAAGISSLISIAAPAGAATPEPKSQITILYDAFGNDPSMSKDWGFSALVEIAGKRILFDTGNNADIFAANVKAKGVDLKTLDFVVCESASNLDPTPIVHQIVEAEAELLIPGVFDRR